VDKELLADDNVAKAVSLVEESAYSDAELWAIDRYWDSVSRERTIMSEKFLKGEAKGHAEGLAEGRAEGRAEGLAEGEKNGIIKTALNMKKEGLTISLIAKMTGLSEEEINKL
jgi:predicted transposase/invertase (TIGR01784 family)